jgi:hypothetical protein
MAHVWAGPPRAFGDALRQLVWRGVNILIPNPGSPFAELVPELRHAKHGSMTTTITLSGMVVLMLAETLLRFRTVIVMKPLRSLRPQRFALFAPLIASVGFGLRHFGVVTVHIWAMRLAMLGLSVALIELPLAIMDNFIVPNLVQLGDFEWLPTIKFVVASSAAVVSAILAAFVVVYDARLYRAIVVGSNMSEV